MLTFNVIGKFMTKFLENIEAEIKNIHIAHGIDSDAISKQVADAVTTGITPLQNQVAELQKAAQDIVTAINNGDSAGAQTIATAAANFVTNSTAATSATNTTGIGETTAAATTGETGTTTDTAGEAGAETAAA